MMPSLLVVLRRVGLAVLLVVGVSFAIYGATRIIPGDPCDRHAVPPSDAVYQKCQDDLFLKESLLRGYLLSMNALARGELVSADENKPVVRVFRERLPRTLDLAVSAMVLAVLAGVPAGIAAATRRESRVDRLIMGAAVVGYAAPIFWWGHLFTEGFVVLGIETAACINQRDYPTIPDVTFSCVLDALISGKPGAFGSALEHLVAPAIVLGSIPLAVVARQTRSAMVEALGEDYVRAARARGLSTRRVVWRHALRGALLPVVTVIGLQVSVLLGGAVLTERVFSRGDGLGNWIVKSITTNDIAVAHGAVTLVVGLVVVCNLVIDLVCGLLDPRTRVRSG